MRVVRGGAVVWGGLVSEDSPCDFNVRNGDILAVHSLARLSGQRTADRKPAAMEVTVIHPKVRPLIVTLLDGNGTSGQVLASKRVSMPGKPHHIIRTHPKVPLSNNGENTILAHGDIIMVQDSPAPGVRITPAVPETTDKPKEPQALPVTDTAIPTKTVDATPIPEPVPVVADYGDGKTGSVPDSELFSTTPDPAEARTAATPVSSTNIAPAASAVPGTAEGDLSLDVDPWILDSNTEAEFGAPDLSDFGSDNTDIPPFEPTDTESTMPLDDAGVDTSTAHYGTPTPQEAGQDGVSAGNEKTAATPGLLLPDELVPETAESTGNTMWYIGGLVGALVLVLGAWIYGSRALNQGPQMRTQNQYKRPVSRRHSKTIKQAPVNSPAMSSAGAISPAEQFRAAPVEKPAAPVIKPILAPAATDAVPAREAPVTPIEPQTPEPSMPAITSVTPPPAKAVAQTPVPPPPLAPLTPVAVEPPMPTAPQPRPAPPVIPVETPAVSNRPMSREPIRPGLEATVASTRILDALIRNELPVTEQPVELPTHLEFFGDSTGPQRLRIDQAHPVLKGPHSRPLARRPVQPQIRSSETS